MSDFSLDDTVYIKFTTKSFADGTPTTLLGTPVLSVYENDSITQITSGVSITVDLDGVTGLNLATIVATTGNGFESKKQYAVVITTGTVNSVSVVGEVVGEFSIDQVAFSVWDEILTGATHNISTSAGRRLRALQDFGLYEQGLVWIDTVNGTAGTVDFENGTINNPVDNIADALTIRASVGLIGFHTLPGSSYTLPSSVAGFEFLGFGYTVALGGQSVSGTLFDSATITGNDSGTNVVATVYKDCEMMSNTLATHMFRSCSIAGNITLEEAGDYFWDACFSAIAGTPLPSVDFQAVAETKKLSIRHYSGGMEYRNFGNLGTHTSTIEGHGQVVLNANCAGGTLAIRGHFTVTDNAGGTVTLSDLARYDKNIKVTLASTAHAGATLPALFTDTIIESYAADGSQPTLAQAIYGIQQFLQERAVVSTTLTVKKIDSSTDAMTFTLNNPSSPTSITRTT